MCFDCDCECGFSFTKLLVIGGNLIFVISGILFISLGIFAKVSMGGDLPLSNGIQVLPVVLVLFGVAVIFISLLGLCGAYRENRILIGFYFVIVVILMIAQFGLVIGAFVEKGKIPTLLDQGWIRLKDDDKNLLQKQFDCCGFSNATDLPGSSCVVESKNSTHNKTFEFLFFSHIIEDDNNATNTTAKGCETALIDFVDSKMLIVIGSGFALLIVEIFALTFSWCLFMAIPRREEDRQMFLNEELQSSRRYA